MLNGEAVGPKEKHAIVGRELANGILKTYAFKPPLAAHQRSLILDAVLYHDKPWELAVGGDIPVELKLVCDVDHLWSFTHQNFWQDTVRKGVNPKEYAANLRKDLDGYFITKQAKDYARDMLSQRTAEISMLERSGIGSV